MEVVGTNLAEVEEIFLMNKIYLDEANHFVPKIKYIVSPTFFSNNFRNTDQLGKVLFTPLSV